MITPCMTALPFEMPWKAIQHEGRPAPRPRPRPFPRSHPPCAVSFQVHDLPLETYDPLRRERRVLPNINIPFPPQAHGAHASQGD